MDDDGARSDVVGWESSISSPFISMMPTRSELVMYRCWYGSSVSSWFVSIIFGMLLFGIIALVVMDLMGDDVLLLFCC